MMKQEYQLGTSVLSFLLALSISFYLLANIMNMRGIESIPQFKSLHVSLTAGGDSWSLASEVTPAGVLLPFFHSLQPGLKCRICSPLGSVGKLV